MSDAIFRRFAWDPWVRINGTPRVTVDLLLQTQGFVAIRVLAEDVMRDTRPAVNAVCQALACRRTP